MIYNCDCVEGMKQLEPESVDMVLTDPPYNMSKFCSGRANNWNRMRPNYFVGEDWDINSEDKWEQLLDNCFQEITRVCKKGANVICFSPHEKVGLLIDIASKHRLYFKTTGVWLKPNPCPRNMNLHYVKATETWIYFVNNKRTGTFNNHGKVVRNFYEVSSAGKKERSCGSHPTQKPVLLLERFISLLSNSDDVVLDPFMGVGSTGVACNNLARKFVGYEKEEKYYEIAKKRILL